MHCSASEAPPLVGRGCKGGRPSGFYAALLVLTVAFLTSALFQVHPDHSNATLRRRQFDSKHTQALTHHDVALFKGRGETFEGDPLLGNPGIVHRSPRVEGTGVYRVVAILDIPQEGMHF